MLGTLLLLFSAQATSAPPAEQAAIFKAAGFTRQGTTWKSGNCDGAESASYSPGAVETFRDLNGDGRPDAIVVEGGAVCYGMTGMHFWLLSKQANGSWKRIYDETAMPEFLKTKGVDGWPDIQMGGPGFCFLIVRWNGKAYVKNRFEYEGKPCKP
jgi:hypothetical protein